MALERPAFSWTPCPGHAYNVRCGPNYAVRGEKKPSERALYDVIGVDGIPTENKLFHIGRVLDLPVEEGVGGLPAYLVVNFLVPNYTPNLIGARRTNGPGWQLVIACRLSELARSEIAEGHISPAVDLARRFMHPEEGKQLRRERLKCIFGVPDPQEPGFNYVTKQLVQNYNYKPFLSKTACSFHSVPERGYFEIDLDTHTWGTAALNGLNSLKSRLAKATLRAGIVIEAEGDEEMPEQMLATTYLSYLDPARTRVIPQEVVDYLTDESQAPSPLS